MGGVGGVGDGAGVVVGHWGTCLARLGVLHPGGDVGAEGTARAEASRRRGLQEVTQGALTGAPLLGSAEDPNESIWARSRGKWGATEGFCTEEWCCCQDVLEHPLWVHREKCIRGAPVGSGGPVGRPECSVRPRAALLYDGGVGPGQEGGV